MLDAPTRGLLVLELRRLAKTVRGLGGVLGAVLLLFFLLDGFGPTAVASALAVAGISIGSSPTLNVLRDRMDGTLTFLQSLPVSPEALAGTRIAAAWAGAAAMASVAASAASLVAPDSVRPGDHATWVLAVFVVCFVAGGTASSAMVAAFLRLDLDRATRAPVLVLVALLGGGAALDTFVPGLDAWLAEVLMGSETPRAAGLVLVTAAPLLVVLSYHLSVRAVRRSEREHRP